MNQKGVASIVFIIVLVVAVVFGLIYLSPKLSNEPSTSSFDVVNKGANTKKHENKYISFNYPEDWNSSGVWLQNYPVESFESYMVEAERMKQIDNSLRIMIGQVIVGEEQKEMSYDENIKASFEWLEFHKNDIQSNETLIEGIEDFYVDGVRGQSFYITLGEEQGYEPGVYPGFPTMQEVYIPLEDVIIEFSIYGDVKENKETIKLILDSIQFKK